MFRSAHIVAASGAAVALVVAQVAAGAGGSGAVGTDVMTFGQDSLGQLGNGALGASHTPRTVLAGASDVAGGREHAMALANGAVWAWGADDKGQVGDGAGLVNRTAPVRVVTSGAKAVTTGHYHSMALMTDGSVRAWGWNSKGQIDSSANSTIVAPVGVSLPGVATHIAAGRAHSLAIVGGDVYSWGDNSYGQLICSGILSRGRVRRPSRSLGAGASGFVAAVGSERVVGDARSD